MTGEERELLKRIDQFQKDEGLNNKIFLKLLKIFLVTEESVSDFQYNMREIIRKYTSRNYSFKDNSEYEENE